MSAVPLDVFLLGFLSFAVVVYLIPTLILYWLDDFEDIEDAAELWGDFVTILVALSPFIVLDGIRSVVDRIKR